MFTEALFSFAALYASLLLIFGMLGLKTSPFDERKDKLRRAYGHPIRENDNAPQVIRFAKSFCLRPAFMQGLVMAVMVFRWYASPYPSLVIAFGLSGVIMSQLRGYGTKFVPLITVAIGVLYGSMHLAGIMYGWHDAAASQAAAKITIQGTSVATDEVAAPSAPSAPSVAAPAAAALPLEPVPAADVAATLSHGA